MRPTKDPITPLNVLKRTWPLLSAVERAVLILDEATSALDTATRDRVFALLRERAAGGCNVILVTHDREIAAKCDDRLELGGTA